MKKRLLILYTKNPEEIYNRMSALGSYIHTLSALLEPEYDIFLNGKKIKQIDNIKTKTSETGQNFIKKNIPIFIKRIIHEIILLKNANNFTETISGKYDSILEFYSLASITGYTISQKQNIPLAIIYDAPIIDEYIHFNKTKPFFKNKIIKRQNKTLKQADSIVVYSKPVQKYLEKKYLISNNFRIHQNIDFSRFEFLQEKAYSDIINIGFIGSFLKWHRVDLLVEVFNMLKNKDINVKLFLIGAGLQFENIKKQVFLSPYKDDIIMPGFADGKQLAGYKKLIHIGIMPSSNWYGAPNKIFEYGAAKMAVVAPKTPTIESLFDNKIIDMFKNNSKQDLFDKLFKLCSSFDEIKSKSNNLFNFVKENYSPEITKQFYTNIIGGLIKN